MKNEKIIVKNCSSNYTKNKYLYTPLEEDENKKENKQYFRC